ncbi:hypothetical protein D3C84_383870 [compost metagenome]
MVDTIAADELVDEFTALVVAHVHHGATVAGLGQGGVFMLETAQGGAFDRHRLRVERVDFHHPAVAVEFVGCARQVEARVMHMPADLLAGDGCAIALLRRIEGNGRIAAAKAVGDIFFARQVGAPRRLAVGAILERPQHQRAAVVGSGFQHGIARRRSAHADRGIAVHPAVVGRALDEAPLAVAALYLDDRDTFGSLCLVHLRGRGRLAGVGEQVAIVGVFVVDGHQGAVVVTGKRKQAHAIVVVAELLLLRLGAAIAAGVERRSILMQGLPPTDQHRGGIAWRQADGITGTCGDALETQQRAGGFTDAGSQHTAAEQATAHEQGGATQRARANKATTAEADHVFEVGGLIVLQ